MYNAYVLLKQVIYVSFYTKQDIYGKHLFHLEGSEVGLTIKHFYSEDYSTSLTIFATV